jgi:hypothetical protein
MGTLDYVIRALADWTFRKRSIGYFLVRGGVALLALLIAGNVFSVSIPTEFGPLTFNYEAGQASVILTTLSYIAAATLIVVGLILIWREHQSLGRKRVFVLEFRGLRDWNGSPLAEAIPHSLPGRREQVLVDLRQRVNDGLIVDPQAAVDRLMTLRQELDTRENGADRRDILYVAGGLAPVPLSFLAGILLDDEASVMFMDWNRHERRWQELNSEDDGRRFEVSGMGDIPDGTAEVVLAVSVSYRVDTQGALLKCGALPLVHLEHADIEAAPMDAHWSEQKQLALGQQFLDTAIALGNRGVRTIHLFFAGPNSLVLRFGSLYDKRNLPSLIVYQYDQTAAPPFTWSIQMPVAGRLRPNVIA